MDAGCETTEDRGNYNRRTGEQENRRMGNLELRIFDSSPTYNVFKKNRLECKLTPYELPWERHCYEIGKLVAIKVCREVDFYEKFAEYAAILKKYNSNHAEVVEWLQKVDCSETVNEVDWLDTLKRKTRQFCQEQKKELSRLYRDDTCRGKKFVQRFNLQDFIGAEA